MNKLVFQIDNNLEDYFAIYPNLNKSVMSINRWTKYLLGLFLLLAGASIFFGTKNPVVREEFGYAATAMTVILVVLVGNIVESINKKKSVTTSVHNTISKGAAQITIDLVGIEMKYAKEIKLIEWDKTGQIRLESNYIMTSDNMGNPLAIIPKGNLSEERWFEIQEITTSIIKSAVTKRHGLYEENNT